MEFLWSSFVVLLKEHPVEAFFMAYMLFITLRTNKRVVDCFIHIMSDKHATEKNIKDKTQRDNYSKDYDEKKEELRKDHNFLKQIFSFLLMVGATSGIVFLILFLLAHLK